MQLIRNSQLLMFCCPGTSSDSSPAVCQTRFSIASLRYRLLSFCYVTDDMESRSQGQCSAKHNGTMRAHPDNRKMKAKKNFPRFARRDHHYKPLYTAIGSGRTTPKYLAPALLTPSHPHVDRCSLSWASGRGLLEVYEGWTDAASAGDLEEVY